MNDDRFDEVLRAMARREYNPPPEAPRELIWARIADERRRSRRPAPAAVPWWRWGTGVAALLALGIGIGRQTVRTLPTPTAEEVAAAAEPADASLPYQFAAVQHLSRAEVFLTSYQTERRMGRPDREIGPWARDLLASTRLLLDSPAAQDPRMRALLQDLELILAQIAQLPARRSDAEVDLIDEALEQRGMISRLRATVPAGPVASGT